MLILSPVTDIRYYLKTGQNRAILTGSPKVRQFHYLAYNLLDYMAYFDSKARTCVGEQTRE